MNGLKVNRCPASHVFLVGDRAALGVKFLSCDFPDVRCGDANAAACWRLWRHFVLD